MADEVSVMVVQEPIQAAIWTALNHYCYTDAIFLAEHHYVDVGTDEALYLLATAYYRAGKPVRTYSLLQQKGCPNAHCRYLLARCCLDLNKLFEAEATLAGSMFSKPKSYEDFSTEYGDAACYALQLLGTIYSKTERITKAAEQYKRSLKLNPFLWSSFQSLCHIGEKPDATKIFQSSSCPVFQTLVHPPVPSPQATQPLSTAQMDSPMPPMPMIQIGADSTPEVTSGPVSPPPLRRRLRTQAHPSRSGLSGTAALSPLTPSFGVLPLESGSSPGNSQNTTPFITPPPMQNFMPSEDLLKAPRLRRNSSTGNSQNTPLFISAPPIQNLEDVIKVPRHRNPKVPETRAAKENKKTQSQKKISCPNAPSKKTKTRNSRTQQELNEINKADSLENKKSTITSTQTQLHKQSTESLLLLLQDIGKAYAALCQFECSKALQLFTDLPAQHYHTGWVLCQVGRAYFEMAEYQKAEKMFGVVRQMAPHHMEGMEMYSTALWHLQREVQLSTLAHELTELDKNSPEAWCATGNCFSLQKEHDVAIKFFQRAIQVDPNFAYAYTLLGHEYVLTEELDKAIACFRNGIRVDPRHYNAWYGIGMIYYKQEKFVLAEVHFRKALSINPQSSVLLCHIGVVQHALKKSESALTTLNKAITIDPKNPLCKFHRASILFATDKYKEALSELEELKQIVPKESLVYFLIGKVHKKLGNTHLALMNFSWAMDLDPKGANNQIKEAIDKRYVTDEDDPSQDLEDSANEGQQVLG